ncbi:hypothetical protein JZM24_13745 [Candidatus Sodalis endolongispinus]|uniref:Glucose dehydrogenase n=1 Tax=Candidatus Sodalis endolongispinus TaxID=2812662 RepID=A0ABS5YDZ1_9GAMM|nr:hypothetical protein [Candidatus Sodalis endolongispinus]
MTKITGKRPGAVYFVRPLGGLMALIGLAMTAGGGYLATHGGSRYFLFMGLMLTVAAGLLIGLQPAGAWIYALAFLLTLCWAIWDAGFSFWPLFSRLFMFGVLDLLVTLAYPPLKARQGDTGLHRACYGLAALLALCLAASLGYTLVPTPIVRAHGRRYRSTPCHRAQSRKIGCIGATPPPAIASPHWTR